MRFEYVKIVRECSNKERRLILKHRHPKPMLWPLPHLLYFAAFVPGKKSELRAFAEVRSHQAFRLSVAKVVLSAPLGGIWAEIETEVLFAGQATEDMVGRLTPRQALLLRNAAAPGGFAVPANTSESGKVLNTGAVLGERGLVVFANNAYHCTALGREAIGELDRRAAAL